MASTSVGRRHTNCKHLLLVYERCRTSNRETFLFATGLCFALNALVLIKVSIIDGVTELPYPPFIILVIFAIASFYVSKKTSD